MAAAPAFFAATRSARRDWKPWYFATPVASFCSMSSVTASSLNDAADSLYTA